MSLRDFRFNLFIFLINVLKIVLSYLIVTRITHYYIITAVRTTLYGFTVSNTKGSIISARKYLIIKRTLFLFKKKFITAGNKRRY